MLRWAVTYKIYNTSGSDISLEGRNLAPGGTTILPSVSLALRTLEEKRIIKIEPVKSDGPTVTPIISQPVTKPSKKKITEGAD